MEKPKLFETKKEFLWTIVILLLILLLRLGWEYRDYRAFVSKPFYFTQATVLNAYEKHKGARRYQVLKLHDDAGHTFYTTTHIKTTLQEKRVRLQLFPDDRIGFWDYVGTFYVKSRIKKVMSAPKSLKKELIEAVSAQHEKASLGAFYNAVFFARPLPKPMREQIARLGVSHLVALSGFHLGILWGVVYGILLLLYKPLQQRYFPYRYALIDVGAVSIILLGVYVWFVGMPPSLVRAYAMVIAGWLLVVMAVELVSVMFLATIVMVLVVLFPSLLVSLGFWFSVAGVFYIFLLLRYTQGWPAWSIMLGVIPLGIFVLMLPVVHMVFPASTQCQLFSPLLSLLFTPFYPLSIVLHLAGWGDLFDPWLQKLFSVSCETRKTVLPLWAGAGYIALSLAAVFDKRLFAALLCVAAGFGVWLYI